MDSTRPDEHNEGKKKNLFLIKKTNLSSLSEWAKLGQPFDKNQKPQTM